MVEESDFDWTLSMGMRICATLFPLCLLWWFQKRSWWQRFGTLQLRGGVRLLMTIQGKRVSAEVEDRVIWKKTKSGFFSIKSLYNVVELRSTVRFPRKIIWSPYVPPKVGFCLGSLMGESFNFG
ncbi:hypothetical protein AAG906_004214 [Vitis piasezkii]